MGAVCAGYDVIRGVHTFPRPLPFFYNLNASDGMYAAACPPDVVAASGGRSQCIVSCVPGENCAGDNYCSQGYRSVPPLFRCGSCALNYMRRNAECVKCPDSPGLLILGLVLVALFCLALAWVFSRLKVNLAYTTVGLDYMQVLSIFVSSRVPWPPQLKELLSILQAFNLNIEIAAPECLMPSLSYKDKWGAILLIPVIILALLCLSFVARYLYGRFVKGQRSKEYLLSHADGLVSLALTLAYVLYLYISRTALEPYNCLAAPGKDDGQTYMAATFEPCGGPLQRSLIPPSVLVILFYTVGLPAFLAYVLYRHRFWIMEDQLLRARTGRGEERAFNRATVSVQRRYGRLYYAFKPDYFYWTLAILLRKFGIAFVALMFRSEPSFQLAMCLLILFLAFAAQVRNQPYMSDDDKPAVLRDHERRRFESDLHARLAEQVKSSTLMQRKRGRAAVDWSAPRAAVALQVLGSVGAWFVNLNTLESVMLAASILVSLTGIMFVGLSTGFGGAAGGSTSGLDPVVLSNASRQCNPIYTSYCDGLVVGVVLLIAATVAYLLAVILSEVAGSWRDWQLQRASAAQKEAMLRRAKSKGGGRRKSIGELTAGSGPVLDFAARIGVVEESLNPLFENNALGIDGAGSVDGSGALAILETDTPPTRAVWRAIQQWCKTTLATSEEQAALIVALKRQLGQSELEAAGRPKRGSVVPGSGGLTREELTGYRNGSRKLFGPMTSGATGASGSPGEGGSSVGSARPSMVPRRNRPSLRSLTPHAGSGGDGAGDIELPGVANPLSAAAAAAAAAAIGPPPALPSPTALPPPPPAPPADGEPVAAPPEPGARGGPSQALARLAQQRRSMVQGPLSPQTARR